MKTSTEGVCFTPLGTHLANASVPESSNTSSSSALDDQSKILLATGIISTWTGIERFCWHFISAEVTPPT